jgi:hypothetical protein
MRLMSIFLYLSLLFFFSCTKKEITVNQTNFTETIDGNVAPPFKGVTTIQIQNYINKIYIDLVGREPSINQMDDLSLYLKNNTLSDAARDQVISDLMNSDDYYNRLWEVYSSNMLQGYSQEDVTEQIQTLDYLIDLFTQQGEDFIVQILEQERIEFVNMQNAITQYAASEIGIDIFIARMINNAVFEEINMGSENFVIASFENLFKRQPTDNELVNSITMVDGISAQLLFLDGLSKSDFVEIMTTVPEFYQGLTIDIYQNLLARLPNSQEMTEATVENESYQMIQRQVMKTAEYAGF